MIKNRYKIINFSNPSRELPPPELTIVNYGFNRSLEYWNSPRCISKFWRLYWNDSPGAILEFNDGSIVMSPGTMVLIPPYTMSMAHTVAPFIHNFVEFSTGTSFASVKNKPIIFEAEKYTKLLFEGQSAEKQSLAVYVTIGSLLLNIPPENFGDPGTNRHHASDERIQKVLEYIDKHQIQKYSLDELCRCANLSKPRFLALFKAEIGITPRLYWIFHRMELIGKLLTDTDMSISEIAAQTGFVDRSHLSRVFCKHTGMTPAAMRKNYRRR
ncbi:MAG: helix-turn-helix transcriptional regulator [Lentisphaerae bacterium]|nr:helix-turn-helix transcriptional regulator [Lentisphaerota bacterium]MBQ9787300.1 helix-turn-helix transcriptional regulator [Lentisphaeria bacterium]